MGATRKRDGEVPKPHRQNIYFFPGAKVLDPPKIVVNVRDLWEGVDDFFLIKGFQQIENSILHIPLEYMIELIGMNQFEVNPMFQPVDLSTVPRDTGRLHAGAGFYGWAKPILFTGVAVPLPDHAHRCKCCHQIISARSLGGKGYCTPCYQAGIFDDYPACENFPHTILVKGYGKKVGEYVAHKHRQNKKAETVQL